MTPSAPGANSQALAKGEVAEVHGVHDALEVGGEPVALRRHRDEPEDDRHEDREECEHRRDWSQGFVLHDLAQQQEAVGLPPILLVTSSLRTMLSKLFRNSVNNLYVLSFDEIPENKRINVIASIGEQQDAAPQLTAATV